MVPRPRALTRVHRRSLATDSSSLSWLAAMLAGLATGCTRAADEAPPPPSPTRAAAAARPPRTVGTADPLVGYIAARDGSWVIVCQARADTDGDGRREVHYQPHGTYGDAVVGYLVLGGGAGEAIDHPVSRSLDDRWLAVVQAGALVLHDAARGLRWALADADLRDDGFRVESRDARAASIADNGARMTFLRRRGATDVVVIRDLATASEREVAFADPVWRAEVDATGRWARVTVIRRDTNGDGRREVPGGLDHTSQARCDGDAYHYYPPSDGDAATTIWLDLETGATREDATAIGAVGPQLVHRRPDGSLALGATPLIDGACRPVVVGTLVDPPRVLAICPTKSTAQVPIIVLGDGVRGTTRATTWSAPGDSYQVHARFVCGEAGCTDLASGAAIVVPGRAHHVFEELALVELPGGAWTVWDLARGSGRPLAAPRGAAAELTLPGERVVEIGNAQYDLRAARRVGTAAAPALTVDPRGRVLRGQPRGEPRSSAGPGPLRWDDQ